MSSPPASALSPTGSLSFPQTKKRGPTASTPGSNKRRKPSTASSASHPLRQASFPPPDPGVVADGDVSSPAHRYSPSVSSLGTGRGNKGRKRGKKTGGATRASTAKDGDEPSAGPNASQAAEAADVDDDEGEDDDDDAGGPLDTLVDGATMSDAALRQQREYEAMLQDAFNDEQYARYQSYRRVRLKLANVRKLVNQVLSQSASGNVIMVAGGFTKVFLSELIDRARDVQREWLVVERVKGSGRPGFGEKELEVRKKRVAVNADASNVASPVTPTTVANGQAKTNGEGSEQASQQMEAVDVSTQDDGAETGNLLDIDERDRGPLTPAHLREALRRYKKDRVGGNAGFQGLSMMGREATASRAGGRRLFR